MSKVKCLYCGGDVPIEQDNCPNCQATSHFQPTEKSSLRRRRFLIFFVLVTLFCLVMILYLPR